MLSANKGLCYVWLEEERGEAEKEVEVMKEDFQVWVQEKKKKFNGG